MKHYELYGPLFFGSGMAFREKFDVSTDPREVNLDFRQSRVANMSVIEALSKLTANYQQVGKVVHLKHLSADCQRLLSNAASLIEVNVLIDE